MSAQATAALDVGLLRLLAGPTRARIVELLAAEQLCTCHLVGELGATQSGVSNHLRLLRDAGLVSTEPHGRFTYYRLEPVALEHLAEQLGSLAGGATTQQRRRPC
jgi:ArsR family transcriptional regulator